MTTGTSTRSAGLSGLFRVTFRLVVCAITFVVVLSICEGVKDVLFR